MYLNPTRHSGVACVLASAVVCLAVATPAAATPPHEPGWAKQIIPTGTERQRVKATPIELRPYRPLHFYGNSVRRQHYRGTAVPAPRDLFSTATGLLPGR